MDLFVDAHGLLALAEEYLRILYLTNIFLDTATIYVHVYLSLNLISSPFEINRYLLVYTYENLRKVIFMFPYNVVVTALISFKSSK